ncbi:MAG: hypothetical protein KAW66_09785 [Candidatus Lokiarchaeota archaeon]|nr:hypothetical protein [Candidatus Lokiarchaeota archaeon]
MVIIPRPIIKELNFYRFTLKYRFYNQMQWVRIVFVPTQQIIVGESSILANFSNLTDEVFYYLKTDSYFES